MALTDPTFSAGRGILWPRQICQPSGPQCDQRQLDGPGAEDPVREVQRVREQVVFAAEALAGKVESVVLQDTDKDKKLFLRFNPLPPQDNRQNRNQQ